MEFNGEAGAKLESGEFQGSLAADFSAALAAGLSCGLKVAVPGFAEAGLSVEGSAKVMPTGRINGGIGVLFNKDAVNQKDMFRLEKEKQKTHFDFEAKASLGFDVNLRAEAGLKVPAIFLPANKTLMKSWNLFHYDVGRVGLQGKVFYDNDKLSFDHSEDVVFNRPGAFNFQSAMVKLEELSTSVTEIDADNEAICRQLETYADAWGLGEVRDTLRLKQSLVLLEMIQGNMDKATSYTQAYDMMKKFRASGTDKMKDADSALNLFYSRDFYKAMEIFGLPPESADKGTAGSSSYAAETLEPNDEQKEQLARLDPVALFYFFAGGRKSKNWDERKNRDALKNRAKDLSREQRKRLPAFAAQTADTGEKNQKKEKRSSGQSQLNQVDDLMRRHLSEIQKKVDVQLKLHVKASKRLVEKSTELDNKELQQQKLNQQDMELVKQIDALQRSTYEEDGKKLEELYQQREKLWKEIAALSNERMELRKEVEKAREEVQRAITKGEAVSLKNGGKQLSSEFSAQRNAISSAQANLEYQQELDQQLYDRVQRGYQRNDNYYLETTVDSATKEKVTVLETNRNYIDELVTWRRNNPALKRVSNEHIAKGRELEKTLEGQQTSVDTVKSIDTAYQTTLKLYENLIRQTFRNEDYTSPDKVQKQNQMLSIGCDVIKELKEKRPNPETLNKLVANL